MDREAWRYFYRFFLPCRRFLVLNLSVAAFQSVAYLPIMVLVRRIFDSAIPAGRLGLLSLYCGGVIVLILFNMLLVFWTRRGAIRAVKLSIRDLRNDLIQRYCAFSRSYYSRTDHSHLRFTLIQDTERLDVMSISLLTQVLPALLVSGALSLLLVYLNGLLFAALMGLLSLALGIAWRMKRVIVAANARYRDSQKKIQPRSCPAPADHGSDADAGGRALRNRAATVGRRFFESRWTAAGPAENRLS